MFGTLDFLRGVGHKLKGAEDGRPCRAVMLHIPRSQPIDIEFKDISFVVSEKKEKKTVLKGVSGKFKSGELTAIMGPSGAGKSSLLNILTGFQTTGASGTISNRECGRRNSNQYRKESCYILQDDQLNPLFTVKEVMMMAANLKLGSNLSTFSKEVVINDVLETLGLANTIETRCGNLSGGQKKRLSIALELIDNPPVMFLDEPTTGLDSSASSQCISMLKNLARGGRTIICTIHQPSASLYELFDHVYILAEGMCVYQGATENTVDYLKTFGFECPKYHNPADYMLEIANCEYGNFNKQLADASHTPSWRTYLTATEADSVENKSANTLRGSLLDSSKATVLISPPSETSKFWVLFNRCLIQLYRDWTVTHLKLVLHALVGIILGLNFVKCGSESNKTISNIGFLLIGLVYLTYTSMMPAILKFPLELKILKKEHFNNWYKLKTYYAAIILSTTPIHLVFATIYCSIAYFMSSQPLEIWRFSMFLAIFMLIVLIAEAIGHVFGTLMNSVNGTFCGAILTCTLLVFAGFLVQIPHMSTVMRTISYASYFRYGLAGLMQALYGYNRSVLNCGDDEFYCHMRQPKKVLKDLGMDDGNYWFNFAILVALLVFMKFVAYFTLLRKLKKS